MNKNIIGPIIAIVLLGGVIWIARPNSQNSPASLLSNSSGLLSAEEKEFNFGEISMANGNVKHEFKIKNAGNNPVVIEKIYTSCMCTTAALVTDGKQFGPYGMPGHGFIPKINAAIDPSKEATVEIVFNPAAHGPAGVGRIQRTITIENNAGQSLELEFAALVTP
ncbi:hypothetical protein A3G50_02350 [Candidatus Jorgensenbacteria bacterium RIFCSPLOWO2_12_FULL_42_11]|uniref:DUF1573 domain-containing protein n=1 Tax=Candidatus Jorgensenbacteria bacterium RIFCSPLOWO2_12_FULL_42_11 TaxID=1798473 RepID=A0A1F6C1E6_9BACT|nr:MAG: hypothetical protein A3G50_02350 [Candidatus Jorgensenbacteria bacterium RIFCSPLOWO2_12_FULL_42_11]